MKSSFSRSHISAVPIFLAVLGFATAANCATTTVTYQVSADSDDGYAWSTTDQDTTAAYLMIGDGKLYEPPYYMSGMRFAGVAVPRSAAIPEAHLRIRSMSEGTGWQVYGVIQAESTDNAADFASRYIGAAARTAASVDWDHKFGWVANTWQISGDISAVVQEVIDRPGWSSGSAMAVLYSTRKRSGKSRMFASFAASPSYAPILEITYQTYAISGYVRTTEGGAIEAAAISAGVDIEDTVTDSGGYYELKVPPGWSGTVTVSKTDWGFDPPSRVYDNITADQNDQDYTGIQPKISGYVTDTNGGVVGVTVSADNGGGSDTTDTSGYYEVAVPYNWSGTVTPSKPGWHLTPEGRTYTNIVADQSNQDYTAFQPKISGYVRDLDGMAIEGVLVSADNGGSSDTTDPAGYYEITVHYDWSGTVTATKSGWGINPPSQTYNNVVEDPPNQDYTAFQPKISGYVTDNVGNGIESIDVLAGSGGGVTTTDVNGYYEIVVTYGWSGTIAPVKTGLRFNPESLFYDSIIADQTNQDYVRSYSGGTGEPNEPYRIATAEDLNDIGNHVEDYNKCFVMVDDINMSDYTGTEFSIIGDSADPFTGVFDGNGHTIANFTYYTPAGGSIGVFGLVSDPCAAIMNVGLIDPNVYSGDGDSIGTLAGQFRYGILYGCFALRTDVSGRRKIGGLAGTIWGSTVRRCYTSGTVVGEAFVGGLAGSAPGCNVSRCYSIADVVGSGWSGGLTGWNASSEIYDCYSAGSISGSAHIGGLVGYMDDLSHIYNSYAATVVVGTSGGVGGLVGTNDGGTVNLCYWDADVSGQSSSAGGWPRPAALMKRLSGYYLWGLDSAGVWRVDDKNDYPRLVWENTPGEIVGAPSYSGGTGEANDPHLIGNGQQLDLMGYIGPWDKSYKLISDVNLGDLRTSEFHIIGTFSGTFDGNGYRILNFTYKSSGSEWVGIFRTLDGPSAVVENVGMINPYVYAPSASRVGPLIAQLNSGDVNNCHVFGGSIEGAHHAGSLVGVNSAGTITNCYAIGPVEVIGGYAGGLVGSNSGLGSISRSHATAVVWGKYDAGALAGQNDGVIANSYAFGSVSGDQSAGGLAGNNCGKILYCYSAAGVSGPGSETGGFVGRNVDVIISSYWDTQTSGQVESDGGIGKTTAEMKDPNTFIGWWCDECWTSDSGNDYPRLVWEDRPGELLSDPGYWQGNGTAEDPYLIYTAQEMMAIGMVTCSWGGHFKLMADVNLGSLSETGFNMVGYSSHPFSGVFDGNDRMISNLTKSKMPEGEDVGVFGYVDGAGAQIKNVWLVDCNLIATYGSNPLSLGSLVGRLDGGALIGCHVQGGRIGGLMHGSTGGLVGTNNGAISECGASLDLVSGEDGIGGLVGISGGNIVNSYAFAREVSGYYSVGGLVGSNSGTVSNCYALTESISGAYWVGGLVAVHAAGSISNCHADGILEGTNDTGGLIGRSDGDVLNSYSTTRVIGDGSSVGGLVGHHAGGSIIASFWDIETSGQDQSAAGIGLTTMEMYTESTFTSAGWDFNTPIWDINDSYPKLWWEEGGIAKYGGGAGTSWDPYLVYTAEHMQSVGSEPLDWNKHFKMMSDIDLGYYDGIDGRPAFNMIGYYFDPEDNLPFCGGFDGNGHRIANFKCEGDGSTYVGIFSYAGGEGAEIKNVTLVHPNLAGGTDGTGSLVGLLENGTVSDSHVQDANVSGEGSVGALVGLNAGTILNCSVEGNISGDCVGGLVGSNCGGTISRCLSAANVAGMDGCAGGLLGRNNPWSPQCPGGGNVHNSYAVGCVTAVGGATGGLAGGNEGSIVACYAAGPVSGDYYTGGLVGEQWRGTTLNSFWDVNSTGQNNSAGGTGLTTAAMKEYDTFDGAGWDFIGETVNGPNDVWRMCVDGVEYPKLWWEFTEGDFLCPDGVDGIDYSFFAGHWADTNCGDTDDCDRTDLDFSDQIGWGDLRIFCERWLEGTGP